MGSYNSAGGMDDLLKQMNETDSQLSLLGKQIERHEKYGDAWNDDENLNYFHMLEQQDELKKKKKKQEEEYDAAVKAAERNAIPENVRPYQASAKAPASKYMGAAGSGTTEFDRLTDAVNRTDTLSNPSVSDDDLWANQTRLEALKWQAEHPGVKKNEADRVYDAIKAMDMEKNPMISDEDILANLDRLEALGGSWGEEDERKKKQKYFDPEDIPNRSTDDIHRVMAGDLYDEYLAEKGQTDAELRRDYRDRYRELLRGLSGSMRRDAVTQMIAQDILDWDAGRRMGETGNDSLERQAAAGYNEDGGFAGSGFGGFGGGGRSSGKDGTFLDYLRNSVNQVLLGNYTDDVTLLGTVAQIGLGLLDLDLPGDVRDLTYDLTHWKWTPRHGVQTLADIVGFLPVVGAVKNTDELALLIKSLNKADDAAEAAGILAKNADGIEEALTDASKYLDDITEGAGDLIDGIKITDGKVGGKIPVDEFKAIRQSSIKNPDADSMTLGKFTDDATSYTQRAGTNSSYFDLGSEWGSIKQKYGLNNNEMFDYFNKSALDDAISKDKTIRFAHNPLDYNGSFLADEWEYLKETLNLTDDNLAFYGGFWYVR